MLQGIAHILRRLGDDDAADAIDKHKQCHEDIAKLCSTVAKLEAVIGRISAVIRDDSREAHDALQIVEKIIDENER